MVAKKKAAKKKVAPRKKAQAPAKKKAPAMKKTAPKKKAKANDLMNQSQFAKWYGISQPRVSKLVSQGKIKKGLKKVGKRFMIDPKMAAAELKKNLDPINQPAGKKAKSDPDPPDSGGGDQKGSGGLDYNKARTATEGFKAQLKKIEYQEKVGLLVKRSEVDESIFKIVRVFRDGCFNVGPRYAARLAAESDPAQVVRILHDAMTELLNDLVESLKAI